MRLARIFIAQYSLPQAKKRLDEARKMLNAPGNTRAILVQETHKWIRGLTTQCSQVCIFHTWRGLKLESFAEN